VWLAGLRRNLLWEKWGAKSYKDMAERAQALKGFVKFHLWDFSHRRIDELEKSGLSLPTRRLTKESLELKRIQSTDFEAGPIDPKADFLTWEAKILGPKDSPYEGDDCWRHCSSFLTKQQTRRTIFAPD
jgi:hypothetical protein